MQFAAKLFFLLISPKWQFYFVKFKLSFVFKIKTLIFCNYITKAYSTTFLNYTSKFTSIYTYVADNVY